MGTQYVRLIGILCYLPLTDGPIGGNSVLRADVKRMPKEYGHRIFVGPLPFVTCWVMGCWILTFAETALKNPTKMDIETSNKVRLFHVSSKIQYLHG